MPRYSWPPGAYREHVRLRCKAERSGAELRSLRRALQENPCSKILSCATVSRRRESDDDDDVASSG